MSLGKFSAAYGEDPTTIDPRGHVWVEEEKIHDDGTRICVSWQWCAKCGAVRGVNLHNGLPGHERPIGRWGHHAWGSREAEKSGDGQCDGVRLNRKLEHGNVV